VLYDRTVSRTGHVARHFIRSAAFLWAALAVASGVAMAYTSPPHTLHRLDIAAISWMLERPRSQGVAPMWTGVLPPIECPGEFDQAIASWNITLNSVRAVGIELRVGPVSARSDAGADDACWSPWLSLGEVTRTPSETAFPAARLTGFVSGEALALAGKVDVDYFTSKSRFQRAQLRVVVPAGAGEQEPPDARVSGLWLCLTDSVRVKTHDFNVAAANTLSAPITIDVPFRSQKTPRPELSGRLCSPSSVAMVLSHRGVDLPVLDVAERGYDPVFDLFGNWPRAAQAAFSFGVPARVTRFNSWDDVVATLARGTPIIASITSLPGELPSAPYTATGPGHLIVLTGLDAKGGVHINDPAGTDAAAGQRVYSAESLTKVWLQRKLGTAYILEQK
jgi:hypothetical protein